MSSFLLGLISVPVFLLMFGALISAARRVLGVRVGTVRTLIGAVLGWLVASGILSALPRLSGDRPAAAIALTVPIAGAALLATLLFLLIAEVAKPGLGGGGPVAAVRAIRSRIGRARRYSQITGLAIRHGLGPYLRGRNTDEELAPARQARLARGLRQALEEGGVTFVKLGQLLSTRADRLPEVFTEELASLQSQVSPAPQDAIDEVLAAELGAPREQVFAEFDPTPVAAASVAQVYRARLPDGTDVVVKVQRPGIRSEVERDLDIVFRVARTLQLRTGWARRLGVVELARGFAEALAEELDFRVEARNVATVRAASANRELVLPSVYPELSTERLLVMSRIDGVPVRPTTLDSSDVDRAGLARTLLRDVLRQVLVHGVFHADPHPGNLLLLADGRLGLLDFGSVGRIDAVTRSGLQALLAAVDRGDSAGLTDGLLEVVDRPEDIDETALRRALGAFMARHLAEGQPLSAQVFTDLFRVVTDFGLTVPAGIAAVFRALATLEGTLGVLSPGFDMIVGAREFATGQIGERLRPETLRDTAQEELVALLPILRRLPRRIDRVTSAAEQGRLSLNVRLFADERDRAMVTGLVHEVLLAFLGATTGIMAVLLLTTDSGPRVLRGVTLYQIFGYNLLVLSALVGLRLLFIVFRGRAG